MNKDYGLTQIFCLKIELDSQATVRNFRTVETNVDREVAKSYLKTLKHVENKIKKSTK